VEKTNNLNVKKFVRSSRKRLYPTRKEDYLSINKIELLFVHPFCTKKHSIEKVISTV